MREFRAAISGATVSLDGGADDEDEDEDLDDEIPEIDEPPSSAEDEPSGSSENEPSGPASDEPSGSAELPEGR
jgi:hypothetical protein